MAHHHTAPSASTLDSFVTREGSTVTFGTTPPDALTAAATVTTTTGGCMDPNATLTAGGLQTAADEDSRASPPPDAAGSFTRDADGRLAMGPGSPVLIEGPQLPGSHRPISASPTTSEDEALAKEASLLMFTGKSMRPQPAPLPAPSVVIQVPELEFSSSSKSGILRKQQRATGGLLTDTLTSWSHSSQMTITRPVTKDGMTTWRKGNASSSGSRSESGSGPGRGRGRGRGSTEAVPGAERQVFGPSVVDGGMASTRKPIVWARTEGRSTHKFCMENHAIGQLQTPPADPAPAFAPSKTREPNFGVTGPLRSVPPPEPHTLRGPPRQPLSLPTFAPGDNGDASRPVAVQPSVDVHGPQQTPKSLRWPQSIIDYLVPIFKPQSQPEPLAEPSPVPAPEPELDLGNDPMIADLLRARAWFRSRSEPVELQLKPSAELAPQWLDPVTEGVEGVDDPDEDKHLKEPDNVNLPMPAVQQPFGSASAVQASRHPSGKTDKGKGKRKTASSPPITTAEKAAADAAAAYAASQGEGGGSGGGGGPAAASAAAAAELVSRQASIAMPESDQAAATVSGDGGDGGDEARAEEGGAGAAKGDGEKAARAARAKRAEEAARMMRLSQIEMDNDAAWKHLEIAKNLQDEGSHEAALIQFDLAFQASSELEKNADAHLQKAESLIALNNMEVAIMELRTAVELDPEDIDTLFKIGRYEQSKDLHLLAIKSFTQAIQRVPTASAAYKGRGISMTKLLRDDEGIRELCQAIHLDPDDSEAYFWRGSLLRTLAPKRALVDLSISLLLDNGEDNLIAFVHRGMLYLEAKRYEEALTDFERALNLDTRIRATQYEVPAPVSRVAVLSHCKIGYIHVHHTKNYMGAIRSFGEAIKEDPTYVQALLSRAECYYRVHRDCGGSESCLNMGIRDYGSAIRLFPDRSEYFILRGKLLLALGNTDLATDQVRAASGLQSDGSTEAEHSFVQAQVQAFLGNHDIAAANMEEIVESLASASYMNHAYGNDPNAAEVRGALMSSGYCHKDLPGAYALLGSILLSAGQYEDAITKFEAALSLDNTNADWFYDLGRCCCQVQDDPLAKEAFSCAIQLSPTHARAYYARGTCRLRMQDPRGIQDVNKALGIDPKMWQAYLSRACYYALSQRFTKAVLNCNKAIEMEPNSVRSYLTRGCIKYSTGYMEGAIEDLQSAVSADPSCSLAWYNLAVVNHWFGNAKMALRAYSTVLLLEDDPNPVVYLNRGVLYFTQRDFGNALHDFLAVSKAPGMATEPRVIHSIALCRHRVGLLEEAVEDYTRAIASGSAYTDALLGRGNVYTDYGHLQGRRAGRWDYQRAIRVDPTLMTGYINLAYSLQCEGQFQDAWNILTAALRVNPNARGVLEARAIVNLQMSNFTGALKDMSNAIGTEPTAEMLNNRGVILIYTGDVARAMEDFEKARELDEGFALAWYNAGNIYLQQRQLKQAREFYTCALRTEANDECTLSNRALVYTLLGDYKAALGDLTASTAVSNAPMLFYNRAVVRMVLLDWSGAEADLSTYLDCAAKDGATAEELAEARNKRGWCKFRKESRNGATSTEQALMDFVDSA